MEKIASLLEKLGMTPQEVVIDWVVNGKIDLRKIQTALTQKQKETVFVTSFEEIEPGMFLYNDGKVSQTYTEGKCSALVLATYPRREAMLMMCLHKAILPFCSQGFDIDTIGLLSGLNATHFIKQMADGLMNVSVDAAQYCLEYSDVFVSQSQAFMLTVDEIKKLEPDTAKISSALRTAGFTDGGFWLSTTALSDKNTDTVSANVAVFMPDRISVQKEYATIPQAVYPVYELKFSDINLEK